MGAVYRFTTRLRCESDQSGFRALKISQTAMYIRRRNRALEDQVRIADTQALDDRLAVASAPYQCRESGVAHIDDRAGLDSGQNRARGHWQKDLAELGKRFQAEGSGGFSQRDGD